jgi:hypothetical protein
MSMPAVQGFQHAPAEAPLEMVAQLSTFADAELWARAVDEHLTHISAYLARVPIWRDELNQYEVAARAFHRRQPFLKWLFSCYPGRREVRLARTVLMQEEQILPNLQQQLHDARQRVPLNKQMQKASVASLRQAKKELALAKKEESITIREIRSAARRGDADVQPDLLETFLLDQHHRGQLRRIRTLEHGEIRRSKEAQLTPHERERLRIDAQLDAIEHAILWTERFR